MADDLRDVVADVVAALRAHPQDMSWTQYQSAAELIADLQTATDRAVNGDRDARAHLASLFAPTGALQDTAMSSGWADEYLALSARFDAVR